MKRKTVGRICEAVIGVTVGISTFFAGSAFLMFRNVLSRDRKSDLGDDGDENPFGIMEEEGKRWALDHKNICTRLTLMSEGCELVGYYYDQGSDKTVILVHGLYSTYLDRLMNGDLYFSKGYNILAIDQRAHGESEGKYCTMGYLESEDVVSWAAYLVDRQQQKEILLDGVSMGASSVLAASGHPQLPSEVKGVISDCGFTTIYDIFKYQIRNIYHVPVIPFLIFSGLYGKILGKFSLKKHAPIDRVKKAKVPILFIHGKEDTFVPYVMSVQLYQACKSKKQFLGVEKAGHAMSCSVNPIKYQEGIEKFLDSLS